MKVSAGILTIGDEILNGHTINTNASWLSFHLNKMGIEVTDMRTIPDISNIIKTTVKNMMSECNLLIITGGLGPTNDDRTKIALTKFFKTRLVKNAQALKNIENYIVSRNGKMNDNNVNQALLPESALMIPNHWGTASGMWFEKYRKVVISLPGVPHEMSMIMQEYGFKAIKKYFKPSHIIDKYILVSGIAEAILAEKLSKWESGCDKDVKIAYLPSPGLVKLRLTVKDDNKPVLEKKISVELKKIEKIIKSNIVGYDNDTPQEIIGKLLKSKNATLCTAESCTGGAISARIVSVPGSSAYFSGAVVAYSNQIKSEVLNVKKELLSKFGAVSREVVEQMAINVRKKMFADYSIAVSGIAGPDGGTKDKPVGTVWIAVSSNRNSISQMLNLGNLRDKIIERSVLESLFMLISELRKTE